LWQPQAICTWNKAQSSFRQTDSVQGIVARPVEQSPNATAWGYAELGVAVSVDSRNSVEQSRNSFINICRWKRGCFEAETVSAAAVVVIPIDTDVVSDMLFDP